MVRNSRLRTLQCIPLAKVFLQETSTARPGSGYESAKPTRTLTIGGLAADLIPHWSFPLFKFSDVRDPSIRHYCFDRAEIPSPNQQPPLAGRASRHPPAAGMRKFSSRTSIS